MIPIHLTIQGLYSYQDKQEIDFARLIEAGLFGIFGAVGSGKSSILEAMSLCIYGKSERFNMAGDNRYYNMLNLKSDEALLEFIFMAGPQKRTYKSIFHMRRNKNKFTEVSLHKHQFYLLELGSNSMPIPEDQVLQDVGISYDNFKRTLIIPQGQFKEFLELTPKDRTGMLKELFSLHRFDLSPKVKILQEENGKQLSEVVGSLKTLGNASPEELEALQKHLTEILEAILNAETTRKELASKLAVLDQLQKDLNELNQLRVRLKTLEETERQDKKREEELNRYELIRDKFNLPLNKLDELRNEVNLQQVQKKNLEQAIGIFLSQIDEITNEIRALDNIHQQAAGMEQKAADLKCLINVLNTKQQLQVQEKKENEIRDRLKTGEEYLAGLQKQIDSLNAQVSAQNQNLIPEAQLNTIRQWYDGLNTRRGNLIKLGKELSNKEAQQNKNQQEILNTLQQMPASLQELLPESFNQPELDEAFRKFNQLNQESLNQLQARLQQLQVKKAMAGYASLLVPGQPCMLCGSAEHPAPLLGEAPDEEIRETEYTANNFRNEQQQANEIKTRLQVMLSKRGTLEEDINRLMQEIQQEEQEIANLLENQPDSQFGEQDQKYFQELAQQSIDARSKIQQLQSQINQQTGNIDKAKNRIDDLNKEIQSLTNNKTSLETRLQMNREELQVLKESDYEETEIKQMQAESEELLRQVAENAAKLSKKQEENLTVQKLLNHKEGELGVLSASHERIHEQCMKLQETIETLLREVGFDEVMVREMLKYEMDTAAIRNEIAVNRQILHNTSEKIDTLHKKVADSTYDTQIHDSVRSQLDAVEEQLKEATEKKGNLVGEISRMQSDLLLKQELTKKKEKLDARASDIATLKSMFTGSRFVDFVSRRYLQNVVASANERFRKMVRQKFSMELSEKGEFLVRDHLNGGKTRMLKSLSGGQTFQAALCLALALSESIQHRAAAEQHFFFLDEGFGSLDTDSLQIVFEALKSLQQEKRIVGLISHVGDLRQEMDIYLSIHNDPEKGTEIKPSWTHR